MNISFCAKHSSRLDLNSYSILGCILILILALASPASAQRSPHSTGGHVIAEPGEAIFPELARGLLEEEARGWLLRGSATFVIQGHPSFRAPYAGERSLRNGVLQANTTSIDLVIGRRLWEGAEFIVVPQFTRGFGLSGTSGVAAFPNGEAFRIGTTNFVGSFPRAFFRQTIALSGERETEQDDDPLRFRGPLPRERITITAGKFAVFDIFDDNRYAHDPRTQFLNWAFVSAGAFDFANDARGFTNGVAIEWDNGRWGLRAGAFQVARDINSLALDPTPLRGWQMLGQVDRFWEIAGHPGALRVLYGASRTNSARHRDMIATGFDEAAYETIRNYRVKHNLVVNWEQEITTNLGMFGRISWNDGRSQSWMYTQMDRAVSIGAVARGEAWGRRGDTFGIAANVGWLSASHRAVLAAGGSGFIAGDGRLRYGPEIATEAFYDTHLAAGVNISAHTQLVVNPAYNRDRGPVPFFALRLRAAF